MVLILDCETLVQVLGQEGLHIREYILTTKLITKVCNDNDAFSSLLLTKL